MAEFVIMLNLVILYFLQFTRCGLESSIRVSHEEFHDIVRRHESPLVVWAKRKYRPFSEYLTVYKGVSFYTTSRLPLDFATRVEMLRVNAIAYPQ